MGAVTETVRALRERRKELGLTQRQVGALLGYNSEQTGQAALAAWERGAREPGVVSLERWAEALGATLEVVPKK
jgi:transcriptional regulator with XRE-family HTH domain